MDERGFDPLRPNVRCGCGTGQVLLAVGWNAMDDAHNVTTCSDDGAVSVDEAIGEPSFGVAVIARCGATRDTANNGTWKEACMSTLENMDGGDRMGVDRDGRGEFFVLSVGSGTGGCFPSVGADSSRLLNNLLVTAGYGLM